MKGRWLRILGLAVGLWALGQASAWAEDSATSPASATPSAPVAAADALPKGFGSPKAKENRLKRFEIIAFGSYPIVLFYTNFGFQVYNYGAHSFDSDYAPWPFTGSLADSLSDDERFTRMGVAAGISLAVATVDLLIRLAREEKARAPAPQASTQEPAPSEAGKASP